MGMEDPAADARRQEPAALEEGLPNLMEDEEEDSKEIEVYLQNMVQAETMRWMNRSNTLAENGAEEVDVDPKSADREILQGMLQLGMRRSQSRSDSPIASVGSMDRPSMDRISTGGLKAFADLQESHTSTPDVSSHDGKRTLPKNGSVNSLANFNQRVVVGPSSRSMENIIASCVSKVCKKKNLALGNIWVPEFGRLVCTEKFQKYTSDNEALHFFGDRCTEYTFQMGDGLPGRVWELGNAEWINDVTVLSPAEYPRLEMAKACGVRASCAVPFVVCGNTLAVLEFVMSEVKERDDELIKLVQGALSQALSIRVNMGMVSSGSRGNLSSTMSKSGSDDNLAATAENADKGNYMDRPLHLRAVSEQWAIPRHEMQLAQKIGEGEEGVIYKASWRGMPVVAKSIKSHGERIQLQTYHHEISVLSHLRHPNLVLFLGACLESEPSWMLSEFLEGGSLEDVIQKGRKGTQPHRPHGLQVFKWAMELARALCFMHNCNPPVIHRDLKPSNLLLTAEGHLKVADFGLSKIVKAKGLQTGKYQMTGVVGTVRYMAPEVILSEEYNEKVDIYSFALVVWYMCTGERPMEKAMRTVVSDEAVQKLAVELRDGLRPEIHRIQVPSLQILLQRAWASDPQLRPSAADVIEDLDQMETDMKNKRKLSSKSADNGKGQCCVS